MGGLGEATMSELTVFDGKFIVFEGIDGSGKDTVRARVAELIVADGASVQIVNDPGSTIISTQLRNILLEPATEGMHKNTELLLYIAARAQLLYTKIIPCLDDGVCVLCNRWVYATHAYQGAGNGTSADIINELHSTMCRGQMPDAAMLIDVPVQVGLKRREAMGKLNRIESRFINSSDSEYYDRVRFSYIQQTQVDLFDQKVTPLQLVSGTVLDSNQQAELIYNYLKRTFVDETSVD